MFFLKKALYKFDSEKQSEVNYVPVGQIFMGLKYFQNTFYFDNGTLFQA